MPSSFWAQYCVKLAILGVVLALLYAAARALKRSALLRRGAPQYVELIESTALSPQTAVHLLRVGRRYVLVGSGSTGLSKLADITDEELERQGSSNFS